MPNLTKRDMVISIAEEVGITQDQTFAVIQKTLDHIIENLALGHNVELRNFGVFEVRLTKQRVGRNPNKPEADVPIPARADGKDAVKSGRLENPNAASLNFIAAQGLGLLDQREEFGAVAAGVVAERASGDVLDFRPREFSSVR